MIIVSACLLGIKAKYNGESNANRLLLDYARRGKFLPICPEQLGGLPTPRPATEIRGGSGQDVFHGRARAVNCLGEDLSSYFMRGAQEVGRLAKLMGVQVAILKERSPSCGVNQIYDGTFTGKVKKGQGVTASLLAANGLRIFSEEELSPELLEILMGEGVVDRN